MKRDSLSGAIDGRIVCSIVRRKLFARPFENENAAVRILDVATLEFRIAGCSGSVYGSGMKSFFQKNSQLYTYSIGGIRMLPSGSRLVI